ncbi:ABC transporter permease [Nitrincola sp.]|uniref:ABC transporter permease n=1 Tax=Nitrincola sp. TaxID=1926584 RepID=UPI003A942B0B
MLTTTFWAFLRHEMRESRRYSNAIVYMTFSDLRARYRRSVLGPFWLTIGTTIGALALSFIWSELMHKKLAEFIPTLTAGLILWQFISGVLGEAPSLFIRQAPLIRNLNLPLTIYPLQLLLRHLLNLLHYAPVYILIALWVSQPVNLNTLLIIPGLLLVTLNLLWLALLIGLLGARFRDLEYLFATAMPLLMLLSPVFYKPDFLPFSEMYIWLNPISHLIEVIRSPLLGHPIPIFVVITNLGLLLFGSVTTLLVFRRMRHRIAFWV